jgi:hypothetical protein
MLKGTPYSQCPSDFSFSSAEAELEPGTILIRTLVELWDWSLSRSCSLMHMRPSSKLSWTT